MKKLFLIFLIFFFFLIPSLASAQTGQEETLEGKVIEILKEEERETELGTQFYQKLEVLITQGSVKDEKVEVEVGGSAAVIGQPQYQINDEVVVVQGEDYEGNKVFYIADFVRRDPLIFLFFLFVVLVITVARWRGLTSLLGLGISFLIIFKFILPMIYAGYDPVLITVLASLVIIPVSFYLSHGFNRKTTIAIGGTLIALIITGFLAQIFVEATKLTGFASEEAGFLQAARGNLVNIKGLLLAGIIIGALGVLDDISIAQSAVVQQLREANPKMKTKELFLRAMNVGQDHIASMVNTLVLVYTGAALPLLLLFINNPLPFAQVVNYEIIAEEIVRTLVGSLGLITAVPVTTFLASSFDLRKK
jgi:uncharacterized membrane protein